MQASDTAYPRLQNNFNTGELEHRYTPNLEERAYCAKVVRGHSSRFGFLLMLKTFQRLGYFVTSVHIPDAIIAHLMEAEKHTVDREALTHNDVSRSRKTHKSPIRSYLGVEPVEKVKSYFFFW